MGEISKRMMQQMRSMIGQAIAKLLYSMFPIILPCLLLLRWASSLLKTPRIVKNKVVLVTGASSGIGQRIALEYAKHGAKLVLAARREHRLREVVKECLSLGASDARICPVDLSFETGCKHVIDFTIHTFGQLDVLVNNAGVGHSGLFEDFKDISEIHKLMDLDFWGSIATTKYALEYLRQTRGQVVVIASVGSYTPYPRQSIYNASKAGLVQYFDTLRNEPIGEAIDITIAMPGFVTSEMTTGAPKGHIPWWWPMLKPDVAAKAIVDASINRQRYIVVPYWYSAWIPFRIFAPEILEWNPRMILLGKPPSVMVEGICNLFLGTYVTKKIFGALQSIAM